MQPQAGGNLSLNLGFHFTSLALSARPAVWRHQRLSEHPHCAPAPAGTGACVLSHNTLESADRLARSQDAELEGFQDFAKANILFS